MFCVFWTIPAFNSIFTRLFFPMVYFYSCYVIMLEYSGTLNRAALLETYGTLTGMLLVLYIHIYEQNPISCSQIRHAVHIFNSLSWLHRHWYWKFLLSQIPFFTKISNHSFRSNYVLLSSIQILLFEEHNCTISDMLKE